MARPRLHDFPAPDMLRRIGGVVRAKREALEKQLADVLAGWEEARTSHDGRWSEVNSVKFFSEQALAELARDGVMYDLLVFTGQQLTPSARIAAQKCIRTLEEQGFLKLIGAHARWVNVTDAGWAKLAELAPKTEAANAQV
ncbi:MAG: hypothetical protein IAF94_20980 [Pirellulaceae bacterium]|nr:hypothetical protein [Pirellulaceae bacterium]